MAGYLVEGSRHKQRVKDLPRFAWREHFPWVARVVTRASLQISAGPTMKRLSDGRCWIVVLPSSWWCWLPDKGQTASRAPGSLRSLSHYFLASCLATARIFCPTAAASALKSHTYAQRSTTNKNCCAQFFVNPENLNTKFHLSWKTKQDMHWKDQNDDFMVPRMVLSGTIWIIDIISCWTLFYLRLFSLAGERKAAWEAAPSQRCNRWRRGQKRKAAVAELFWRWTRQHNLPSSLDSNLGR